MHVPTLQLGYTLSEPNLQVPTTSINKLSASLVRRDFPSNDGLMFFLRFLLDSQYGNGEPETRTT